VEAPAYRCTSAPASAEGFQSAAISNGCICAQGPLARKTSWGRHRGSPRCPPNDRNHASSTFRRMPRFRPSAWAGKSVPHPDWQTRLQAPSPVQHPHGAQRCRGSRRTPTKMSGAYSRRKGRRGEREVVRLARKHGLEAVAHLDDSAKSVRSRACVWRDRGLVADARWTLIQIFCYFFPSFVISRSECERISGTVWAGRKMMAIKIKHMGHRILSYSVTLIELWFEATKFAPNSSRPEFPL